MHITSDPEKSSSTCRQDRSDSGVCNSLCCTTVVGNGECTLVPSPTHSGAAGRLSAGISGCSSNSKPATDPATVTEKPPDSCTHHPYKPDQKIGDNSGDACQEADLMALCKAKPLSFIEWMPAACSKKIPYSNLSPSNVHLDIW